jgi:DNA modification methylase
VDHWTPDSDIYAAKVDEGTLLAFPGQQTTVWDIPGGQEDMDTVHSTQKALECMARPIRNHTHKIVYEPFLGSGTTLVTSENLDVKCLALELTPEYIALTLERAERAFPGIKITRVDPR